MPFRASKLTFLLKDSLAGNSKTYMVAALSPASDNVEETISTLRFASSVKQIKTVAVQNKDKKDEMIDQLKKEIAKLKARGFAKKAIETKTASVVADTKAGAIPDDPPLPDVVDPSEPPVVQHSKVYMSVPQYTALLYCFTARSANPGFKSWI